MEVKINKDIREFQESIFFGLSMRQFIFSILACLVAVLLYFLLKPYFDIETLSWVCILGAVPFAVLGFVKYNGMTAEQFIVCWFRSKFLFSTPFLFQAENYYAKEFKPIIDKHLKRDFLKNTRERKTKKVNSEKTGKSKEIKYKKKQNSKEDRK